MPEGDVVFRTCARLDEALAGEQVVAGEIRWPGIAEVQFADREVVSVQPRGKHILLRLSPRPGGPQVPITVHSHLRMAGSWRLHHRDDPQLVAARKPRSHTRVWLETTRWVAIGWRLGMVNVVPTDAETELVGHLGPDILGPDWCTDTVLASIANFPDESIGAVLLDQRVLAGIGTFFMAESLFVHGCTPWTRCADVPQVPKLLTTAQRMLVANCTRAVQSTTGSTQPGQESYVHGRRRKPCRRCRTPIQMLWLAPLGGQNLDRARTAYFCPTCQRGPVPRANPAGTRSRQR